MATYDFHLDPDTGSHQLSNRRQGIMALGGSTVLAVSFEARNWQEAILLYKAALGDHALEKATLSAH